MPGVYRSQPVKECFLRVRHIGMALGQKDRAKGAQTVSTSIWKGTQIEEARCGNGVQESLTGNEPFLGRMN